MLGRSMDTDAPSLKDDDAALEALGYKVHRFHWARDTRLTI